MDSTDWQKINGYLVRLYRELSAEKHAHVMLQVLNELVPSDSMALNVFEPPDKLSAITLPENLAKAEQMSEIGRFAHQSPFASYYLATQDVSWKMTTDFMPLEEFHLLDIHRRGLGPLGINQQMGAILAHVDGATYIISLHRTHRGFTENEREILNALHPHLVTSFLNAKYNMGGDNRSVTQLKALMETAPGAYGYINKDGSVAWMQSRAQAWLLEFFPDETNYNGNMPPSVLGMITSSRDEGGTPKSITQFGNEEFLTIFLSASSMGGWSLRLERKPRNNPARFRRLTQLTPAENDVLRWMVEGKRNAEIGIILNISSRTVEKHAAHVLAKLNVENRATAIIRAMELAAQQVS